MCPGEGGGSGSGGDSGSGPGDLGGGDISAILAYLNHWSFGKDGDYTGNAGYGGDNIGPVGSKEPPKDDYPGTAFFDDLMTPPGELAGSRHMPATDRDRMRGTENSSGSEARGGGLFAFVGHEVDVYSGLPAGSEDPDPFTGLPYWNPFEDAGRSSGAGNGALLAALRPPSLLSSPALLADNGVAACDPNRASCLPEMKSDANQSSLANLIRAETDESYLAIQALVEGKAKVAGNAEYNMQELASRAAQITRSDEYKLAFIANQLRDHPLEVRHSSVLTGLGHMASGGVMMVISGAIIYGSGGLALPLIGATGFAAGTAELSSGFALAISGADSTETVRMSGQLDYVFALTKSPTSLMFGTTGLVLGGGDVDISHRFAVVGGIAEDVASFRGDPSKLYSAVIPGVGTKAEKGASSLLARNMLEGHRLPVPVSLPLPLPARATIPIGDLGRVGQITSKSTFRRFVTRVIREPNHPLHGLINPETGRLTSSTTAGMTKLHWFEDPRIIEAGHWSSAKGLQGAPDRLIIMSAYENRLASAVIEHPSVGGFMLDSGQVVNIGGLPVDLRTAEALVDFGTLEAEELMLAPFVLF